ncbi:MAG TPA: hypothetical protein VF466_00225 [Candidatus Saccharimonadales bacterium]
MTEVAFTVAPPVFDVLPAPDRLGLHVTGREKGVLMDWDLTQLPSHLVAPPEIRMRFLTTDLNIQHDRLLYYSDTPYDGRALPVHTITPRRRPLFFSVDYTKWLNGSEPLDLGVLFDSSLGDVRESKHYAELRQLVAVACARAILDPEGKGMDGSVRLKVNNNFRRPRLMAPSPLIEAACLAELQERLEKS